MKLGKTLTSLVCGIFPYCIKKEKIK